MNEQQPFDPVPRRAESFERLARSRRTWPNVSTGGMIALTVVALLVLAGLMLAPRLIIEHRKEQFASLRTDPNAPLTQKYTPKNRLYTAHYPADFTARSYDDVTLIIKRPLSMSDEEMVTVTADVDPATDDVHEFARVMEDVFRQRIQKRGAEVMKGDLRPAKCPTEDALYDGIEIIDLFRLPWEEDTTVWSCAFFADGHGYRLAYMVPYARITQDRPLLERIVKATELAR
jgi:hypothetical protein